MDGKQITQTAAFLMVSDIHQAVRYYAEKLGFQCERLWGEPPTFAMPHRDGQIIMLSQVPPGKKPITNHDQGGEWDAYFWINDAEALFSEVKEKGALIEHAPVDREYGIREFAVMDQDGHILAFGQNIE